MPCRDYYDENPGAYQRELRREAETKLEEKQRRLDAFARHICFLCGVIDKVGGKDLWAELKNLPKNTEHGNAAAEIEAWWKQHQKDDAAETARKAEAKTKKDAARKAKEEAAEKKLAALAKLNTEDRKALGLR